MIKPRIRTLRRLLREGGILHVMRVLRDRLQHKIDRAVEQPTRAAQLQHLIQHCASQHIMVIVSTVDYKFPYHQRPQHLARAFSELGVTCFYVSPNGGHDKFVTYDQINTHLILVDALPLQFPADCEVSYILLSTDNALSSELIQTLRTIGTVVYDYIDEISEDISLAPIPASRRALHAQLLADEQILVLASAAQLHQQVAAVRRTGFALVTNGVHVRDFAVQRSHQGLVPAFAALLQHKRPIIGYYGALASWFDYALVKHIASALPQCDIVLIGPNYDGSATHLQSAPANVHWLQPMDYSMLPQHAIWFDICTIPFLVNGITQATSPLKLYEYLALGKPVVTADMPECRDIPYVQVARDADEFVAMLQQLLGTDLEGMSTPAREVSTQFAWAKKAGQILTLLEQRNTPGAQIHSLSDEEARVMADVQSMAGLSWGTFALRLEYEYKTAVRPLQDTVGGRRFQATLEKHHTEYEALIQRIAKYRPYFSAIPVAQRQAEEPYWNNGWLPSFDGALIYTLLAEYQPLTYLEVGSGNSTKFARRAIQDHGLSTRLVSLDPYPRAEIDHLCDEIIRLPIEQVSIETILDQLHPGDVIFIDNSHRSFQGSDVTVVFTELLPALPSGILLGIHDIFLPYDYPHIFADYFYNEQYLLFMYLLGQDQAKIMFPTWYCCQHAPFFRQFAASFDTVTLEGIDLGGSSFWLQT